MRKLSLLLAAIAISAAAPTVVNAKGCLKGAAVGGVAGHVAGHHGLLGAGAGCVIEHHREKVRDKAAAQPAAPASPQSATPTSTAAPAATK